MQTTLDQKFAWWIEHRLNVMLRRRGRDQTAKMLKTVFDHAGLKWRHINARGAKADQIFADDSIEAFFFDDLDRTPKKFPNVVLDLLTRNDGRLPNLKLIWVAVNVSEDEDGLDLENLDPAQAEGFDVEVDVRSSTSKRSTFAGNAVALLSAAIDGCDRNVQCFSNLFWLFAFSRQLFDCINLANADIGTAISGFRLVERKRVRHGIPQRLQPLVHHF